MPPALDLTLGTDCPQLWWTSGAVSDGPLPDCSTDGCSGLCISGCCKRDGGGWTSLDISDCSDEQSLDLRTDAPQLSSDSVLHSTCSTLVSDPDESRHHLTAAFELITTDLDPLSAEPLAPWTYGLDSGQLWPVGHSANSGATDFLKNFLKDCKPFDSSIEQQLTKTKTITGAEAMSSEPTWLSAKSGVVSNLGVSPPWAWSEPPLCHVYE